MGRPAAGGAQGIERAFETVQQQFLVEVTGGAGPARQSVATVDELNVADVGGLLVTTSAAGLPAQAAGRLPAAQLLAEV